MVKTNCHKCEHKRKVPGNYHIDFPGNYHISCAKPDHEMNSDPRVISKGWFMFIYPLFFDPDLMTNECENYSPMGESEAMNTPRVLMRSSLVRSFLKLFGQGNESGVSIGSDMST